MMMEKYNQTEEWKTNNLTNAGKGRAKGVPNANTKALKDMILASLDKIGGEAYLCEQAEKNPTAFLTLIGKVLPLQVHADLTTLGDKLNINVNFIKSLK